MSFYSSITYWMKFSLCRAWKCCQTENSKWAQVKVSRRSIIFPVLSQFRSHRLMVWTFCRLKFCGWDSLPGARSYSANSLSPPFWLSSQPCWCLWSWIKPWEKLTSLAVSSKGELEQGIHLLQQFSNSHGKHESLGLPRNSMHCQREEFA